MSPISTRPRWGSFIGSLEKIRLELLLHNWKASIQVLITFQETERERALVCGNEKKTSSFNNETWTENKLIPTLDSACAVRFIPFSVRNHGRNREAASNHEGTLRRQSGAHTAARHIKTGPGNIKLSPSEAFFHLRADAPCSLVVFPRLVVL